MNNMNIKENMSLTLEFDNTDTLLEFQKDDLITYRGAIFKVIRINMDSLKTYVFLELKYRAVNIYSITRLTPWHDYKDIKCIYDYHED